MPRLLPQCRLAAAALAGVLALSGCGAATHSPRQQHERERKAAGLAHFLIICPPDLWDRTDGAHSDWGAKKIPAKITTRPDGLITVDLSGPSLVDLLKDLDYNAHAGWATTNNSPLAIRLYDAIAPVVDKVSLTPGSVTPQVIINDAVPGTPSPASSPRPSKGK